KKYDDNTIVHKVQPGETFYGLSKKYNIPLGDLMKLNNIELKAGQEIVVGYKNQAKSGAEKPVAEDKSTPAPSGDQKTAETKTSPAGPKTVTTTPAPAPVRSSDYYAYDSSYKQVL